MKKIFVMAMVMALLMVVIPIGKTEGVRYFRSGDGVGIIECDFDVNDMIMFIIDRQGMPSIIFAAVAEDGYNYSDDTRVDVYYSDGVVRLHTETTYCGYCNLMRGMDENWDITSRDYHEIGSDSTFGISFDDGD